MSLSFTNIPKKLRKQLLEAHKNSPIVVETIQPVITEPGKKRKRQRRKKRGGQLSNLFPNSSPAKAYINTLNDPFTHGPERLGWCTLVPSALWTAYGRTTTTANADGTFAAALFATLNGLGGGAAPLYYNRSGSAGTTWTAVDWANQSTLQAVFEQGRPVSLGLRIIPQVPATSAPATVFAGSVPCTSPAELVSNTCNFFAAEPFLKMGYGCEGAVALGRPTDVSSFQFTTSLYNQGVTVEPNFSVPIILFQGLPASAPLVLEYVLNFESIRGLQSSSAAIQSGGAADDSGQTTLVDIFPSIESMWNGIKNALSDPGTVNNMARVGLETARIGGMAYSAYSNMRARSNYFGTSGSRGVMIEEVP